MRVHRRLPSRVEPGEPVRKQPVQALRHHDPRPNESRLAVSNFRIGDDVAAQKFSSSSRHLESDYTGDLPPNHPVRPGVNTGLRRPRGS